MCEELQATVVELSEARELARQFAFQRDQGETRLQSILSCIYEQNTVLGKTHLHIYMISFNNSQLFLPVRSMLRSNGFSAGSGR